MKIRNAILGAVIGDALGVPFEFRSRTDLDHITKIGMEGHGSHRQPPGTWSDDSSLLLCSVESILECEGIDLHDHGRRFLRWRDEGHWTARGEVFDIGGTTALALQRIRSGASPLWSGPTDIFSCGNGSLMRILPAAIWLAYNQHERRQDKLMRMSSITHAHPRCRLACAYFGEVIAALVNNRDATVDYATRMAAEATSDRIHAMGEQDAFRRLLRPHMLFAAEAEEISGSGYVIDCLEAALWCAFWHEWDYQAAMTEAIRLGEDTDTTACVTGGIVGMTDDQFEYAASSWIPNIARSAEVVGIATAFEAAIMRTTVGA